MAIFKLHITHVFINSFGKERWPFLNYTLIFLVRENSDYDLQIDLSKCVIKNGHLYLPKELINTCLKCNLKMVIFPYQKN
jgi:hypothetical protein